MWIGPFFGMMRLGQCNSAVLFLSEKRASRNKNLEPELHWPQARTFQEITTDDGAASCLRKLTGVPKSTLFQIANWKSQLLPQSSQKHCRKSRNEIAIAVHCMFQNCKVFCFGNSKDNLSQVNGPQNMAEVKKQRSWVV